MHVYMCKITITNAKQGTFNELEVPQIVCRPKQQAYILVPFNAVHRIVHCALRPLDCV